MPRTKADPSIPVFDFQLNPEKKELSPATINIYKGALYKITKASYEKSLTDKRKKPIVNKKNILEKATQVVEIINTLSGGERQKQCVLYSAVFYAVGSKNLTRNKKMSYLVEEFRKIYNDETYKAYKEKKAAAEESLPPVE